MRTLAPRGLLRLTSYRRSKRVLISRFAMYVLRLDRGAVVSACPQNGVAARAPGVRKGARPTLPFRRTEPPDTFRRVVPKRTWTTTRKDPYPPSERPAPSALGPPASEALDTLTRALRLGECAAELGFDWPDLSGPLAKVEEELEELRDALTGPPEARESELGDLLFAVVNLARHLRIDPARALNGTYERFRRRFSEVDEALAAQGRSVREASLEELEELWNRAKATRG